MAMFMQLALDGLHFSWHICWLFTFTIDSLGPVGRTCCPHASIQLNVETPVNTGPV